MAQFKEGESGNPAGRPKGSLNKSTRAVKEALEEAFDELGGVPALLQWARRDPGEFFKLWAKMLPKDISVDVGQKLGEILDGIRTKKEKPE